MQHILVLIDTLDDHATELNRRAISCAQHIGEVIGAVYSLLVNSPPTECATFQQWLHYGAKGVFAEALSITSIGIDDAVARLIKIVQSNQCTHVVAPGEGFWSELLARLSATIHWQLVGDVTHVEMTGTGTLYHGPWIAGQAHTARRLTGGSAIFTPAAGTYQPAHSIATNSPLLSETC